MEKKEYECLCIKKTLFCYDWFLTQGASSGTRSRGRLVLSLTYLLPADKSRRSPAPFLYPPLKDDEEVRFLL